MGRPLLLFPSLMMVSVEFPLLDAMALICITLCHIVLEMPQPTLLGNPRCRNSQLEVARLPFALKNLLEELFVFRGPGMSGPYEKLAWDSTQTRKQSL